MGIHKKANEWWSVLSWRRRISKHKRTKKYMMDCVHNGSTWKVQFCEVGMYQWCWDLRNKKLTPQNGEMWGQALLEGFRQKEEKKCAKVQEWETTRSLILCELLAIWYGHVLDCGEGRWLKNEQMVKFPILCPISAKCEDQWGPMEWQYCVHLDSKAYNCNIIKIKFV